ncbi:MAG: prephenate dehydrogenase/arogenate dehydrogenase family protein [Pseudomonadales bacterium]|nr:prephenate dehydrogenase/arogenate dehydrogenase family protein [Pseudomonadales bacterium]
MTRSEGLGRVAIIGLGLMGGSIARGLRTRAQASEIVAYDRRPDEVAYAIDAGFVDAPLDKVQDHRADLVVLAVPVLSLIDVLAALHLTSAQTDVVVTDVGSVKQVLVDAAITLYGEVPAWLIPGHPIAGSERHGVQAANGDLFTGHRVILTPGSNVDNRALSTVKYLWEGLGATITSMSVQHHDSVLAQTSHLPHLLAYALVDTLSRQGDSLEVFEYAAGGFRDFSRIAASDPDMWADIFISNQAQVLENLDRFSGDLSRIRELVAGADRAAMKALFQRAKQARDYFSSLQSDG